MSDPDIATAVQLAASARKMKAAGEYAHAANDYQAACNCLGRSLAATLANVDNLSDKRKAKYHIDTLSRWLRLAKTCKELNSAQARTTNED